MPSGFNSDERRQIISKSILPMLRDDGYRIVDITCPAHGNPGLGAPNFVAAMVCMITCEVIGRLSDPVADDTKATLRFIRGLADTSGDVRYRDAAEALVAVFRNGIAHSFRPKGPRHIQGRVAWAPVCVRELARPEGRSALEHFRGHEHLVVSDRNGIRTFTVVPQVFYLDLRTGVDALEQRWLERDFATLAPLERAFERWWKGASDPGTLGSEALHFLGI